MKLLTLAFTALALFATAASTVAAQQPLKAKARANEISAYKVQPSSVGINSQSSQSRELGVTLSPYGYGKLIVDGTPMRGSKAQQIGLEYGDVLYAVNGQQLFGAQDVDRLIAMSNRVRLSIVDVNTGNLVYRTWEKPRPPVPSLGKVIRIDNQTGLEMALEIVSGTQMKRQVVPAYSAKNFSIPSGWKPRVQSAAGGFDLGRHTGDTFLLTRIGSTLHMQISTSGGLTPSTPVPPVPPTPSLSNFQRKFAAALGMRVKLSPYPNSNGKMKITSVFEYSDAKSLGLRRGDVIVGESYVGIPLVAGQPAQPGKILTGLVIERFGNRMTINTRRNGTIIIR